MFEDAFWKTLTCYSTLPFFHFHREKLNQSQLDVAVETRTKTGCNICHEQLDPK